jgi:predicted nucleic acid-binding protein
MNLVLDTSAGIELALGRVKAKEIASLLTDAAWVIAPELYMTEAANTFWKLYHMSNNPLDQCEKALDSAISFVDDFFSSKDLYREAFGLACLAKHPVYDMLFCVLARRHNAQLVSIDKKLCALAVKHSVKVTML